MNKELAYSMIKELSGDNDDKITEELHKEIQKTKKNFLLDDNYRLHFRKMEKEKPRLVIIGPKERERILTEYHDSRLGGHYGIDNTIERIKKFYYWPQMSKEIEEYVRSCPTCQKRKTQREDTELHPIIREPKPFKHIGIDVMGPLPLTMRGKRYIVLAVDLFTKWIEARAIEEADAQTIATFVYEDVICRHGIPAKITSDRGTEFVNELMSELTKEFGIKHIKMTAYHPQGNGQTERSNQTIKNTLSKNTKHGEWDIYLPSAVFASRVTRNQSTKFTPAELIYGRQLIQVRDEFTGIADDLEDATDELADHFLEQTEKLNTVREKAHLFIEKAQERQKSAHDKKIRMEARKLHIGDKVLLWRNTVEQNWSAKLEPKWDGPYFVQDIKETTISLRTLQGNILPRPVHRNRLKLYTERPKELKKQ